MYAVCTYVDSKHIVSLLTYSDWGEFFYRRRVGNIRMEEKSVMEIREILCRG